MKCAQFIGGVKAFEYGRQFTLKCVTNPKVIQLATSINDKILSDKIPFVAVGVGALITVCVFSYNISKDSTPRKFIVECARGIVIANIIALAFGAFRGIAR